MQWLLAVVMSEGWFPWPSFFSQLIFSPTCALRSSSLVVISWHTFSSSTTIAMSSAKSKSVKRLRFCQTMPYFELSIVLRMTKSMTIMKRNGERMQSCRTPETISKNSCVPTCSLDTAAGVVTQCLEDVNEPVRSAVVCQNFPQGWPVYTVKCLFEIDEVNDEVLLML